MSPEGFRKNFMQSHNPSENICIQIIVKGFEIVFFHFQVSEEEDAQEHVHAILDVKLRESSLDPTRLEIIPVETKRSTSDQEDITNERIVQFVLESRAGTEHTGTSTRDYDEEETASLDKLIFYANPVRKIAFLNAFHVALSNLHSRNFQF